MRSKIAKIGFEIEGEFHPELMSALRNIGEMKHDGSVHSAHSGLDPREYNSPVLEKEDSRIDEIFGLFQNAYKNKKFDFNDTCGFHIHMSFEPKKPPEILSYIFYETFMNNLQKCFPGVVRKRISGRFCKAVRDDKEVFSGDDRYRAVNFQPALRRHGTIEFRIYPSSTPEQMRNFLKFTINQVEIFLREDHVINFDAGLPKNLVEFRNKVSATVDLTNYKRQFKEICAS